MSQVNSVIQIIRSLRIHIVAAILAAYSLYHGLGMVAISIRNFKDPPRIDTLTAFDNRLAPLRAQLTQYGSTEIGYITDVRGADWFTGYSRTQYALAPILVDDSTDLTFVVANLSDPSSVASIMRNSHLVLVSDYGNGVFLLSRETH